MPKGGGVYDMIFFLGGGIIFGGGLLALNFASIFVVSFPSMLQ